MTTPAKANVKMPNKHKFTPLEAPKLPENENFVSHSDMPWPLMSECLERDRQIQIMNDKTPNKHNLPDIRSFTFDDDKNDWVEESYHNFYFFEGEDAKVIYHYSDTGKAKG